MLSYIPRTVPCHDINSYHTDLFLDHLDPLSHQILYHRRLLMGRLRNRETFLQTTPRVEVQVTVEGHLRLERSTADG